MRLFVAVCLCAAFSDSAMAQEPPKPSQQTLSDPTRAGRSMAMSAHGMVATAHPLATLAGVDILRAGGTAADAAIAAAAVLAVVEPMMTGLGGDAFALYFDAETREVHALNGSGRSPRNLPRAHFAAKDEPKIETNSWESVTVPGAADAYVKTVQRFGSLTLQEVLAPAIRYADEGFPVTEVVRAVWLTQVAPLRRDAWAKKVYLVDGRPPDLGHVFKNPYLAESRRILADGGSEAFYEGPIAKEIVRYARETGGFLTMEDFAAHDSEWVQPIHVDYRGYEVYQCPPNGQGLAMLMMLNILEGFDLAAMDRESPEYVHLLVEAKKLAYAELARWVADPETFNTPVETLLSDAYAADRRALIDPEQAMAAVETGLPRDGDTTYLCVVDQDGNACSFINSLYGPFGSGIVGGSTGILLQNRGEGFTLESGHPNEYAPGKRPFHTIIPGMILKDGALYLAFGVMGGDMQPQGQVQVLLSHLEHGLNIQEAASAPRWRHMEGLELRVERGFPDYTARGLEALGHEVKEGAYVFFGGAQAVLVDPETGVYFGASDSRKDGLALGW